MYLLSSLSYSVYYSRGSKRQIHRMIEPWMIALIDTLYSYDQIRILSYFPYFTRASWYDWYMIYDIWYLPVQGNLIPFHLPPEQIYNRLKASILISILILILISHILPCSLFACLTCPLRFLRHDGALTPRALLSEWIVSSVSQTLEPTICSNSKPSSTQLLFMEPWLPPQGLDHVREGRRKKESRDFRADADSSDSFFDMVHFLLGRDLIGIELINLWQTGERTPVSPRFQNVIKLQSGCEAYETWWLSVI